MRPTALSLAALACSATVALAQPALFSFSGEVVEVFDPEGLLDPTIVVGGDSLGSFGFDASTGPFSGPASPFGQFPALNLDVSTGNSAFPADTAAAVVFDNVIDGITGDGSIIDVLILTGPLVDADGERIGEVRLDFFGDNIWFQGFGNLPNPSTLGLQNVLSATLQVTLDPIPVDPFGPGGFDIDDLIGDPRAAVIIELRSIANANGNNIATIGCVAAQLAAPVALSDISDTSFFIDRFLANDDAVDLNRDGLLDVTDVDLYIDSFINCI